MRKYYQVMVEHYFPCQDGYDSIVGEYSGMIHTRKSDAEKELRAARKELQNVRDESYIKEIEDL